MNNIVNLSNVTFNSLHERRKKFSSRYKNQDHIVMLGNEILISAPHGVSQVRLGKYKYSEIGSLATALFLKDATNCSFIAKTKNNNDDANFDIESEYKNSIRKLIESNKINYIIDIHGLGANRDCDINLGTHLGKNIENNTQIFTALVQQLENNGFIVSIDQPFMANYQTISSHMKNLYNNLWTIQIEINCSITNNKENIERYKKLLFILKDWIDKLRIFI